MTYLNKVSILQLKDVIANNKKYPYLIVFSIAVILRLIPEIVALPYPIGYDVINYYLPILVNFDNHWTSSSTQFPLYILLLHAITSISHIDPRIVITASVVFIFGLFSVVIYTIARNIFHLNYLQGIFLSIFVIVQVSLLRTSWDLHKDIFALTITLFCLSYLSRIANVSIKNMFSLLPLSIITVLSDRMIGLLLSSVLIVYSLIKRERMIIILAIVTSVTFATVLFSSFDSIRNNIILGNGDNGPLKQSYNSINLVILFLVMGGILVPTGVIGIMKSKNVILKIPLIISLAGSFSWIIFPDTSAFLPDRWIVIFSVFLSIFSGYGFVTLIENKRIAVSHNKLNNYIVILIPFLFLGFAFAASPNNSYINVYGAFHPFIGHYGPLTMQYNSISLPESGSLLSLIDWVNHNTSSGSVIMGSKHLRGWMELGLINRTFLYSDNITEMVDSNKYSEFYLLESDSVTDNLQNYTSNLSYNNTNFSLYQLKRTGLK
jgi:hypothetical protein